MYGRRRRYGRRSYGRRYYGRRYYRRRYYRGVIMPIPLVAGVMLGAGTVLTGYHAVRKAHETQEFWKNYRKNSGLSPRYPFRAGVYDFYHDVGRTSIGIGALYGRIL